MKAMLLAIILFSSPLALARLVPLDLKASTLEWLGQKIIPGGDHKGTVKIKSGSINLNEKQMITGGTIVLDMTTIEDTDLSGKWKKKLEDHLNGEDFFDVKNHKEAQFKITKVEPTRSNLFKITGNLTIRGKTNVETFEVKVEKKGKKMVATGTITFDRTRYGVSYNSEASFLKQATSIPKDKVIKDKIQLTLNLTTQVI